MENTKKVLFIFLCFFILCCTFYDSYQQLKHAYYNF